MCTTGDTAHIETILKLLPHTRQHVDTCVAVNNSIKVGTLVGLLSTASMTIVRNMFPGHLISHFGDVPWPPRSPDLSTYDFFLWGYL